MEPTDHDIRTFVKGSVKGEAESCKKLYEHLVDKIYAYVQYRTVTKEQAIDITQDVFIDFFSTVSNFAYQSPAQLYAYVFVITRRKLARHYEFVSKHGEKEAVVFDEEHSMVPSSTATDETRNDIQQALQSLDEQTREIVVLHHWSRYTFGEIALLMNMAESAIRVRHHRALKALGTKLGEVTT